MPTDPNTASILIRLFGGDREQYANTFQSLIRVTDGNQKLLSSKSIKGSSIRYEVPFHDNMADSYSVFVSAKNCVDAGFFPVKVSPDLDQIVDLMLIKDDCDFHFVPWSEIKSGHAEIIPFLCCGEKEADAQERLEDLVEKKPAAAASLLNLATAMSVIHLPTGSPLDYIKEIEWDDSFAQDRFFAYADEDLIQQVRIAAQQGEFAPEPNPGMFHKGATSSYKQIQFGEANVQLTFHEEDTKKIGGTTCVRVEPDIDYFKDLGAHGIFEVIPNSITHGLTDPKKVYMLRWIAGRRAGVPEFDPPYTLE